MRKLLLSKVLLSLLVLTVLVAFGAMRAEAEDTALSVTVTVGESLSVTLNKGPWEIGTVDLGNEVTTQSHPDGSALGTITATNESNCAADLDIAVAASSGNWALVTSGTPSAEQFAMLLDKDEGHTYPTYIISTSTGVELATNLAASTGTQDFDLKLLLPSSTTYGGTPQAFDVTVTVK